MDLISITCDDRTFKTKRKTINNLFGTLPPNQSHINLDTDPDYFEEILEELRESSGAILNITEYLDLRYNVRQIREANLELDVGGKRFYTRKETLCRSNYFATMFE